MTAVDISAKRSVWSAVTSGRASVWVHYATLAVGFAALIIVGRGQWFYFDEWDIIWPPEAARRFVEGHNGHWSAVPIAIWWALQRTLGLTSYLPYLAVAVLAHLTVAHLLWRILRRAGSSPWIATSLVTVFIFLGAGAENIMWAFQLGFMGGIAFGLGAVLLAIQPTLRPLRIIGIGALLTVGSATAGTVLPFFVAVAIIVLVRWGWLRMLMCVGPPAVIYLIWFLFVAGPNPSAIYRARGIGDLFMGVPEFAARMFVGGYNATTPVFGLGLLIVVSIGAWVLWSLLSRRRASSTIVVSGLIAAGIVFSLLTAYSRVAGGMAAATESRYVYVIVATTLPCVALLLTRLAGAAILRQLAVFALIAVVLAYNVGLLLTSARNASLIEVRTHELISAALDLADEFPGAIDPGSRPDPVYLPRTLEQLQSLETDFGLPRVPYTDADRLAVLTNVSLTAQATAAGVGTTCDDELSAGETFTIDQAGTRVRADDGAELTLTAFDGDDRGSARTLSLTPGDSDLTVVEPTRFSIDSVSAPVRLCVP